MVIRNSHVEEYIELYEKQFGEKLEFSAAEVQLKQILEFYLLVRSSPFNQKEHLKTKLEEQNRCDV